jgi:chemotaxis protein MotB
MVAIESASLQDASAPDHGEGENYFVSMTDMMVGMLFIFIIMLMSFALLFRQQTDVADQTRNNKIIHANDIEQRLEDTEKHIREQIDQIRQATLLRQKLLKEIDTQLRRENLIVQVDESNGVLHLTEDTIRFRQSDASLSEGAKQNVGKIARVLARVLPGYVSCLRGSSSTGCQNQANASVETVFIEGHTDITGLDKDNWDLSARRAANTYIELILVSPELRQYRNHNNQEILSISGYSSARPIDSANNLVAWEKNRRIDLRFVMDTDVATDLEKIQGLLGRMRTAIGELKETP